MTTDYGIFNLSLQSVEWQMKHLFEEVGGEDAIRTLDKLSTLPKGVQQNLLLAFERIIEEVKSGSLKLQNSETQADDAAKEFETSLLSGISEDISRSKFAVIDGGKSKPRSNKIINFPEIRREVKDDKLIA